MVIPSNIIKSAGSETVSSDQLAQVGSVVQKQKYLVEHVTTRLHSIDLNQEDANKNNFTLSSEKLLKTQKDNIVKSEIDNAKNTEDIEGLLNDAKLFTFKITHQPSVWSRFFNKVEEIAASKGLNDRMKIILVCQHLDKELSEWVDSSLFFGAEWSKTLNFEVFKKELIKACGPLDVSNRANSELFEIFQDGSITELNSRFEKLLASIDLGLPDIFAMEAYRNALIPVLRAESRYHKFSDWHELAKWAHWEDAKLRDKKGKFKSAK